MGWAMLSNLCIHISHNQSGSDIFVITPCQWDLLFRAMVFIIKRPVCFKQSACMIVYLPPHLSDIWTLSAAFFRTFQNKTKSYNHSHFTQWLARCVRRAELAFIILLHIYFDMLYERVQRWQKNAGFELFSEALFFILYSTTSVTFYMYNQAQHHKCLHWDCVNSHPNFLSSVTLRLQRSATELSYRVLKESLGGCAMQPVENMMAGFL